VRNSPTCNVSSVVQQAVGGYNTHEICKLILTQISLFIRIFEMHRLWYTVHSAAVNSAQSLVRDSVHSAIFAVN